MRAGMAGITKDSYDRYVKSGVSTRAMVEKESDFDRIVPWGLPATPRPSQTERPLIRRSLNS